MDIADQDGKAADWPLEHSVPRWLIEDARLEMLGILSCAAAMYIHPDQAILPKSVWLTEITTDEAAAVWHKAFGPAFKSSVLTAPARELARRASTQREFFEAAIQQFAQDEPTCSEFELACARTAFVLLPALALANWCDHKAIPQDTLHRPVQILLEIARRYPRLALPPPNGDAVHTLLFPAVIVSLSIAMLVAWYIEEWRGGVTTVWLDDDLKILE